MGSNIHIQPKMSFENYPQTEEEARTMARKMCEEHWVQRKMSLKMYHGIMI